MKKLPIVVVALAAAVVGSCYFLTPKTTYHPSEVTVVGEGVNDHGLTLTFRPPSESAFHCPGVTAKSKGHTVHFEFVRAPIDSSVPCDIKATRAEDGSLSVTFPFPKVAGKQWEKIELIDSRGKSRGPWEAVRAKD